MRTQQRGFTLAELIIVLVLTGVLASVAVPRMFDMDGFSARGSRDFVASALRYARKSAIAMRRNVCVAINPSQLVITYAGSSGANQACPSANALLNPGNNLPYADASNALPAKAPVTTPASLIFDAQGRPFSALGTPLAAALTVSVTGQATPLTIEAETGHVH